MSKKITKHILVLSGATLGTCIGYTPAAKGKPTEEVIRKYITTHTSKWKYSPMKNYHDHIRSEKRKKEILANIGELRKQIRDKAQMLRKEQEQTIVAINGMLNIIMAVSEDTVNV